jgi:hypothetical protein
MDTASWENGIFCFVMWKPNLREGNLLAVWWLMSAKVATKSPQVSRALQCLSQGRAHLLTCPNCACVLHPAEVLGMMGMMVVLPILKNHLERDSANCISQFPYFICPLPDLNPLKLRSETLKGIKT